MTVTYKCVSIGDKVHAAQTQAALAVVVCDGRTTHGGWTLCGVWADGKLRDARPDCAECLSHCELHERRVASGEARELPAMGAERARASVEAHSEAEAELLAPLSDGVERNLATEAPTSDLAQQAVDTVTAALMPGVPCAADGTLPDLKGAPRTSAGSRAVAAKERGDDADAAIEAELRANPGNRNQAIVDAIRARGGRASFGRVDKVRARIGIAEPAKPVKGAAPAAPKRECTPECLAGGKPCSPECAADLGVKS